MLSQVYCLLIRGTNPPAPPPPPVPWGAAKTEVTESDTRAAMSVNLAMSSLEQGVKKERKIREKEGSGGERWGAQGERYHLRGR